jgi:hypothetical protein
MRDLVYLMSMGRGETALESPSHLNLASAITSILQCPLRFSGDATVPSVGALGGMSDRTIRLVSASCAVHYLIMGRRGNDTKIRRDGGMYPARLNCHLFLVQFIFFPYQVSGYIRYRKRQRRQLGDPGRW